MKKFLASLVIAMGITGAAYADCLIRSEAVWDACHHYVLYYLDTYEGARSEWVPGYYDGCHWVPGYYTTRRYTYTVRRY